MEIVLIVTKKEPKETNVMLATVSKMQHN